MIPYRTLLITALATLAYALIAGGLPLLVGVTLVAYFTLLTGALNALNSWSDVAGDAISWKDRPLVTGQIGLSQAFRFSLGLIVALTALVLAMSLYLAAPLVFALGVFDTLLIVAYSVRPIRLKRFAPVPGIIVGLHVTVVPALTVWIAAGWPRPFPHGSILFLFVLAYVTMLTEDFTDVSGDRAIGDVSLPLLVGPDSARRTIAGLYLVAGVLAPFVPGLSHDSRFFLPSSIALITAGLASTKLEPDSRRTRLVYHLDTAVVTLVGITITLGLIQPA